MKDTIFFADSKTGKIPKCSLSNELWLDSVDLFNPEIFQNENRHNSGTPCIDDNLNWTDKYLNKKYNLNICNVGFTFSESAAACALGCA